MIYKVYWLDGTSELIQGNDITDAFNKAGYGAGAINAIDFYSDKPDEKYMYDKLNHEWVRVQS